MASQQDSTTQSIYSLGSEERDITNMGLMHDPTFRAYKQQAHAEA